MFFIALIPICQPLLKFDLILKRVRLFGVAGGFKSFSVTSPHLVRSDVWSSCDVSSSNNSLDRCRELATDTFRCHPSTDQVLTHAARLIFPCYV